MDASTLSQQRRLASTDYARTRFRKGPGHPDTIAAARAFGAAKLAETVGTIRGYGLDELDMIAVVRTGKLPPEASAA
jgi:hypothetical protein